MKRKEKRPGLFVGSSLESIDVARCIQEELDNDAEVTVWDQGLFELSKNALDSLTREIKKTDFCLFVFCPSDMCIIRDSTRRVVRDNVVFELGLSIGSIGIERSFILVPSGFDNFHLPTDLLGVTTASYDPGRSDGRLRSAVAPACNRVRDVIRRNGIRGQPLSTLSVRVGFSGATSVGKRTLAGAVQSRLQNLAIVDEVFVIQDVGRSLVESGFSYDRATRFSDYAAYFQRHLRNVNIEKSGCMLYVRTLFDTIAYAEVNGNFTGEWMGVARELARLCARKFDLYFYIPIEPNVPVVDGGGDPAYRIAIDDSICRILGEFYPRYTVIRGSIEERLALTMKIIEGIALHEHVLRGTNPK